MLKIQYSISLLLHIYILMWGEKIDIVCNKIFINLETIKKANI